MQTVLTSKNITNTLPVLFKISLTIKNLIFILAALLSFILWFSATLKTPAHLEKVEETLHIFAMRQSKLEGEVNLISQDTRIIKNILLRSDNNDK
ncbi:MAG: hypothetical protein J6S61_04290 [Elusimicrobiaceae bacterium]|nr:hypothetical protein [Elusimicrobiaceae bacterium]